MLFFFSPFQNAYHNIALEYHLIHNFSDEFLILYINRPSVIIGKHQNAFSEANFNFIKKNEIPIVRRISGGGTVYHDQGNLNISIITNRSKINMQSFLFPIILFLKQFDINVTQNEKYDILINQKKVTGTAAHIFKNRSLQHGTLLINTSINFLNESLKSERENFISNSISSKPSVVTNLLFELKHSYTFENIVFQLKDFLCNHYHIQKELTINESDILTIESLVQNKFSVWEWNYGYSPAFVYKGKFRNTIVNCFVTNGIIQTCKGHLTDEVSNLLIGKKFDLPLKSIK